MGGDEELMNPSPDQRKIVPRKIFFPEHLRSLHRRWLNYGFREQIQEPGSEILQYRQINGQIRIETFIVALIEQSYRCHKFFALSPDLARDYESDAKLFCFGRNFFVRIQPLLQISFRGKDVGQMPIQPTFLKAVMDSEHVFQEISYSETEVGNFFCGYFHFNLEWQYEGGIG